MKDIISGFEPIGSWGMFLASGKTPKPVVDKLNTAIQEALQSPMVAGVMHRDGYVPDHRDAEQSAAFFRLEVDRAGAAAKAAGIEPN